MMTGQAHDQMLQCRSAVLDALTAESAHRSGRDDWEMRERVAMTVAANQWALAHGYPTITTVDVEALEPMVMGHVDYARKIALYIAERVCVTAADNPGTEQ